MGALQWDQAEQKFYHSGVSKVILFPNWNVNLKTYTGGVAWNGVTSIEESPDGGEANDIWADNVKYGSMRAVENLKGSISAYQWPDALNALDGKLVIDGIAILGQQKRTKRFGLCYRTEIGTEGNPNAGYQLHFLYDMMISPSEKSYETTNDSPDATEFSWDFECLPQKQTVLRAPKKYADAAYYYDEVNQTYDVRYATASTNAWTNREPTIVAASSSESPRYAIQKILIGRKDGTGKIIKYIKGIYILKDFYNKVYLSFGNQIITGSQSKIRHWTDDAHMMEQDVWYSVPGFSELEQSPNNSELYFFANVCMFRNPRPPYDYYDIPFNELQDLFYYTSEEGLWDEKRTVRSKVKDTYGYSSVTLDSRSTSAEKMTSINNMIYDGENRMPTLPELLG